VNFFHRDKHRDDNAGLPPGYVTAGSLGHSPNGTPLDQILHARTRRDPLKWLMIPGNWGFRWSGPQAWADVMGQQVWDLWVEQNPGVEKPDPAAVDRTALELRSYAEKFGGYDPLTPFEITTYLHLPSPTVSALPVKVWVDDTPGLTIEAATTNPDAIKPPLIEKFHTDTLGDGLKVTTHGLLDPEPGEQPDTTSVWISITYAFAVPTRQAVVTIRATDTDLGRMTGAATDIDEFVNLIHLEQNVPDGLPVPWSPPGP
jgi:hypothetical protein